MVTPIVAPAASMSVMAASSPSDLPSRFSRPAKLHANLVPLACRDADGQPPAGRRLDDALDGELLRDRHLAPGLAAKPRQHASHQGGTQRTRPAIHERYHDGLPNGR